MTSAPVPPPLPPSRRPPLLPTAVARDLLDVHLASDDRGARALYAGVLALLVAGAAALPVARVELWAHAAGIVRPTSDKHEVRAPRAGAAHRLLVAEHQRVREGEPLLALDPRPAALRAAAIAPRLAAARDAAHDLEALAAAAPARVAPGALVTARYRDEQARHAAALHEAELRRASAGAAAQRTRALAARGFATPAELEADAAALLAANAALATLAERQAAEWQGALADARAALATLRADARENAAEREALVVRAPVAGTVEQVARLGPGSFVQGGEVVAVISPERSLVAELHVAPRDVARLRVGSPVRLEVDAFDPSDWGLLAGRVLAIADDYVDVAGRPMFRVRCALDATHLALRDGTRGRIRKGMTVRARFPVGRRTLLQIIRDGADGWLDPTHDAEGARAGAPRDS